MMQDILFYLVFLSQIYLISWYFPASIVRRARHVHLHYPPSEYPRLYPEPMDTCVKKARQFIFANRLIVGLGLFLLVNAVFGSRMLNIENGTAALVYFFIQFVPVVLMDMNTLRAYRQMRQSNTEQTRKAPLQPRHLFDFVSPLLVWATVAVFLGYQALALGLYINGLIPAFKAFVSMAVLAGGAIFFGSLIGWMIYGRKQDPYQSHEDRARILRITVTQMVVIFLSASVFTTSSLVLNTLNIDNDGLEPVLLSLYLQFISMIGFRSYQVPLDTIDFEVYRRSPAGI